MIKRHLCFPQFRPLLVILRSVFLLSASLLVLPLSLPLPSSLPGAGISPPSLSLLSTSPRTLITLVIYICRPRPATDCSQTCITLVASYAACYSSLHMLKPGNLLSPVICPLSSFPIPNCFLLSAHLFACSDLSVFFPPTLSSLSCLTLPLIASGLIFPYILPCTFLRSGQCSPVYFIICSFATTVSSGKC